MYARKNTSNCVSVCVHVGIKLSQARMIYEGVQITIPNFNSAMESKFHLHPKKQGQNSIIKKGILTSILIFADILKIQVMKTLSGQFDNVYYLI